MIDSICLIQPTLDISKSFFCRFAGLLCITIHVLLKRQSVQIGERVTMENHYTINSRYPSQSSSQITDISKSIIKFLVPVFFLICKVLDNRSGNVAKKI